MDNFIKLAFRNALLFGLYQVGMVLFLDVAVFFRVNLNWINFLGLTFASSAFFYFALHTLLDKIQAEIGIKRILNTLAFIGGALLSGAAIWWLFQGNLSNLIVVLSAFVIPALLPALAYFMYRLMMENQLSAEEEPLFQNSTNVDTPANETEDDKLFVLENENGKKLLEVSIARIICFEANDNYVVTYYLDKEDKLKKSMERISLKRVEEMLIELKVTSFSRVHKSYLIHRSFVDEVKGKAQAYKLKLFHLEILIPVSRTFPIDVLR